MATDPSFDGALAFARDLIRIPSPPGAEADVAERVRRELETLAFEDVHADAAGNVLGRIPGSGAGPSVMLSCHLDVVAEGDPAQWEHPPFEAVVEGGFLHGRGAMDIKGPLALQTHAAAALRGRAPGDVWVAHTVLEERGGLGMQHLLDAGDVKPDAVIIGESTHGDVCIGHRGRGEVEIVLHGLAGHASAPARALNALSLLPAVLEAVFWELRGDQPVDDVLGAATVTPTSVEVEPSSRNVIPDQVVVALDWRILPGMDDESLVARVREVVDARLPELPEGYGVEVRMAREAQRTYTGLERERGLLTPGFLMDPDAPVVRAAAAAVGNREGGGPARVRPWAFATDGGWTCGVHGIPTVGFAPGEERYAHTNRERLELDEARWAYDRYPGLVLAMQEALGR